MKNFKKLSREDLKLVSGGVMEYLIKCCKTKTCPTNPNCLIAVNPV